MKPLTIFISSSIVGLLFIFTWHFELYKKIPGLYCESYGCIGFAILLIFIGALVIPAIFATIGYCISKESRGMFALKSFAISFIVMAFSFLLIYLWNEYDIKQATEEGDRATEELYLQMKSQ